MRKVCLKFDLCMKKKKLRQEDPFYADWVTWSTLMPYWADVVFPHKYLGCLWSDISKRNWASAFPNLWQIHLLFANS